MPFGVGLGLSMTKMGESNELNPELAGKDLSLLQKPIMLSVQNVRQVLSCLDSGTTEMKDLILNECGLLYECKVCRSIFRNAHHFVEHRLTHCGQMPSSLPLLESLFRLPHHYTEVVQPAVSMKDDNVPPASPLPAKRNKRKSLPHKNIPLPSKSKDPALMPVQTFSETRSAEHLPKTPPNLEEFDPPPTELLLAEEMVNNSNQSNHSHAPPLGPLPLDNTFKENISPVMNQLLNEENACDKEGENVHNFDSYFKSIVDEIKTKKMSKCISGSSNKGAVKKKSLSSLLNNAINESKISIRQNMEISEINEDFYSTNEIVNQQKEINGGTPFKMYKEQFKNSFIKNGALDRPAKSWNGKIFESYIKQLEIKKKSSKNMTIQLTPIPGNKNAMFQVSVPEGEKEMRQPIQLRENQLEQKPLIVVLSKQCPDSPSQPHTRSPPQPAAPLVTVKKEQASPTSFCCAKCRANFVSAKTLHIHNLKIHAANRTYFPCPFCKTTFVQLWSACRHLESVHKKSKEQIHKLRETIKKRGFLKKNETTNVKPKNTNQIIPGGPLTFKCPKCSKVFSKRQQLATHDRFCIRAKAGKEKASAGGPLSPEKSSLPVNIKKSFKEKKNIFVIENKIDGEAKVKDLSQASSPSNAISRPKRLNTNKKMDKDFVNSQTYRLKDMFKSKPTKKSPSKSLPPNSALKKTVMTIENKVMALINMATLECVKCQKSFSSFSNLRRHTAIHIGWKRYCCRKCQRAFYNKSQCREHLTKLHSIEKPDEHIEELPFKAAFSGRQKVSKLTHPSRSPEKSSSASSSPKFPSSPSKAKSAKKTKGSSLSSSPHKSPHKRDK